MTQRPRPTPPRQRCPQARERVAALAKPTGALGRLEDLAVWGAAARASARPRRPQRTGGRPGRRPRGHAGGRRLRLSARGHRRHGRRLRRPGGGVSVLARQHGVSVRVLDLAVDVDLTELPTAGVRTRSAILRRDPPRGRPDLRRDGASLRRRRHRRRGDRRRRRPADPRRHGIGNTTPAASLIAATFGLRRPRSPAAAGDRQRGAGGARPPDPTGPGPRRRPGRRPGTG